MLVNTLGKSSRKVSGKMKRFEAGCSSLGLQFNSRSCLDYDPVINAVSGTYRLGVDFVMRRAVIGSTVVKLQVVGSADCKILSESVLLILFSGMPVI